MFAYVLISLELAILFAAFWYVFIREPKPFRVKSSMWGSYEVGSRSNDVDTLVNEYAAPRVPFFAGPQLMPANYESEFAGVQTNNLSNQDWNTLYSRMSASKETAQYGWVVAERKPMNPLQSMVTGAVGWFESLSSKLP